MRRPHRPVFLLVLLCLGALACSCTANRSAEGHAQAYAPVMASYLDKTPAAPAALPTEPQPLMTAAATSETLSPAPAEGPLLEPFVDAPMLAFHYFTHDVVQRSTGLAADAATVNDPLSGYNRFMFQFNDAIYSILRPFGEGYNYVVPEKGRIGVRNFFHNLKAPVRIVNSLLQGKFKGAGVHMARFVGNTAFGFLGVAGTFNDKPGIVEVDDEDFGQTLAVWGFGDGFYLMLPFIGPSTLRDTVGLGVDRFMEPVNWISPWPFFDEYDWQWIVEASVGGYETFNEFTFRMDEYETFKEAAIEPYSAMRDAYIQRRQAQIAK